MAVWGGRGGAWAFTGIAKPRAESVAVAAEKEGPAGATHNTNDK